MTHTALNVRREVTGWWGADQGRHDGGVSFLGRGVFFFASDARRSAALCFSFFFIDRSLICRGSL